MALTDRLATDISKLIDLVSSQSSQITALGNQITAHDSTLADTQVALQAAQDKTASLESQIEALQTKLDSEIDPGPLEGLASQIEAITNANPAPADSISGALGNDKVTEATAPTVTQAPSGAIVTVDPTNATTTHEADTGVTTTVDHATGRRDRRGCGRYARGPGCYGGLGSHCGDGRCGCRCRSVSIW